MSSHTTNSDPKNNLLYCENALLGAMVLNPELTGEMELIIPSADAFSIEKNQRVFRGLQRLYRIHDKALDIPIMAASMTELDGDRNYLVTLAESVPSPHNWRAYAEEVRARWDIRRIGEAAHEVQWESRTWPSDESTDLIVNTQSRFDAIAENAALKQASITAGAALGKQLDAMMSQEQQLWTPTGFGALDELIDGLGPGQLNILAARPAMGKTALGLNIALNIALRGIPVAFLSLEMSLPQLAERLMCSHAKIELSKVRKRQLTKQDYDQLISSCGTIAETPFFLIDSPRLSIGQCASHIRRLAKTDEARIVIVDYLQLIHGPTRDGRVQEVGHISRTLKETARATDCSILSLCQLNRDVEKRDSKRPRMSDLRESGSIEQDADRVLMLHRESYYHQGDDQWHNENPTASGEAEIIVAKNRHGSTGIATIGWDARTTTFQGPVGPLPKEDYQQWR